MRLISSWFCKILGFVLSCFLDAGALAVVLGFVAFCLAAIVFDLAGLSHLFQDAGPSMTSMNPWHRAFMTMTFMSIVYAGWDLLKSWFSFVTFLEHKLEVTIKKLAVRMDASIVAWSEWFALVRETQIWQKDLVRDLFLATVMPPLAVFGFIASGPMERVACVVFGLGPLLVLAFHVPDVRAQVTERRFQHALVRNYVRARASVKKYFYRPNQMQYWWRRPDE